MRLKRLIKTFQFEEDRRADITLGANVRLVPEEHWLQLKEGADGFYPLTAGLFAKTWVSNPLSVRQWLGFEVYATHFKNVEMNVVTSLGFRLSDGTDQFRWNGSAWVVNTTTWNTEEEVATNISSFPVTSKRLQVVINLVTTDKHFTPRVHLVKVLYSTAAELQEDYTYCFTDMLKEQTRCIADYLITLTAAGATVDLATTYKLETPYDIVDIDAVFNHTDDPGHVTNLFQSFNAGTQVITLTGSVASGKKLWIRFIWRPTVAFTTSTDFTELAKVPALLLEDFDVKAARVGQFDHVSNRATNNSVKVLAPLQGNMQLSVRLLTDKAVDLLRLMDEMRRVFAKNPFLVSKALDERFRLHLVDEGAFQKAKESSGVQEARLVVRVMGAVFFDQESQDTFNVQRFIPTYVPRD